MQFDNIMINMFFDLYICFWELYIFSLEIASIRIQNSELTILGRRGRGREVLYVSISFKFYHLMSLGKKVHILI
jgi:hypothetical protein